MDGSVCGSEKEPIAATQLGQDCLTTKCPSGSTCLMGMIPQCCNDESKEITDLLYNNKCPNGLEAAGKVDQYFLPTVAKSCGDLICDPGYGCQMIGKQFAKCCLLKQKPSSSNGNVHKDTPLSDIFNQGLLRLK